MSEDSKDMTDENPTLDTQGDDMSSEDPTPTEAPHQTDAGAETQEPSLPSGPQKGRLAGRLPLIVALIATLALGLVLGSFTGSEDAPAPQADVQTEHEGHDDSVTWTCSMHPQIQSGEPGTCPICGMDLIPMDSGGGGESSPERVSLSKRALALAKIRTVPVRRLGDESKEMRLLGRVERDETRVKLVTAWTAGRIDKLRVASTGEKVRRGQVIASLYSPEVYASHRDLLHSKKQLKNLSSQMGFARSSAEATLESSRQKLRLLGVNSTDLSAMEKSDKPWTSIKIRSPFSGTVTEKLVNEGAYVTAGGGIYRLSDLSKLWVQLDAYESDLPRLRLGQNVEFRVDAIPGEKFTGTISFIDPLLNVGKRTTIVRVEVANDDGRLRPGMFVNAIVEAGRLVGEAPPLVIPDTAPLFSGRRSVVYVEVPNQEKATYEAREVSLGPKAGDIFPVLAGLSFGEKVVMHGAFAIDADLQIRGGASLMTRGDDHTNPITSDFIEVPPEFRQELATVVEAYLELQAALADDNWEGSQVAAKKLTDASDGFQPSSPAHAAEVWSSIRKEVAGHGQHMAIVRDIEGAREAFDGFSRAMTKVLAHFGNPTGRSLRLAYCPMAFENRGAEWIQAGETIDNSYFGSNMLLCGEIREQIPSGSYLKPGSPKSFGGEQ